MSGVVELAAGELRLAIDPGDGGRITSLVAAGREWLAPAPRRRPSESFVAAGTGGWDECLPTVAACTLDGVALPDHGEAWRRPWRVHSVGATAAAMSVALDCLPLHLHRVIALARGRARIDWRLTTTSEVPIPVLWAAHPLFAAPAGTRIEVAAGSLRAESPDPGRLVRVPAGIDEFGPGRHLKAFATGLDHAAVAVPGGARLRLSWHARLLPHLGLYWDRDCYTTQPVVAVEPSTGASDSAAAVRDALPTVTATAPLAWWLEARAVSQPPPGGSSVRSPSGKEGRHD